MLPRVRHRDADRQPRYGRARPLRAARRVVRRAPPGRLTYKCPRCGRRHGSKGPRSSCRPASRSAPPRSSSCSEAAPERRDPRVPRVRHPDATVTLGHVALDRHPPHGVWFDSRPSPPTRSTKQDTSVTPKPHESLLHCSASYCRSTRRGFERGRRRLRGRARGASRSRGHAESRGGDQQVCLRRARLAASWPRSGSGIAIALL